MHCEIVTGAWAGNELLTIDRPGWAWEFLRRNQAYRDVFTTRLRKRRIGTSAIHLIEAPDCPADQRRWGLQCLEDAALPYADANVFWQAEADPRVIVVTAHRARDVHDDNDQIDFRAMPADVTVLKLESGREHILIRLGPNTLQLNVAEGSVLQGPVTLSFQISGFDKTPLKILALRRLIALRTLGRFPVSLCAPDSRAKRWLMGVRALDMQHLGKSRDEMAQILFGESLSATRSDWVLSRLRRLLSAAHHISEVGYFGILAGGSAKVQGSPLASPHDGHAHVLPFPTARPMPEQ